MSHTRPSSVVRSALAVIVLGASAVLGAGAVAAPATAAAADAATPSALPPWTCGTQTGGSGTPGQVTDVRVGTHPGYDRFVVQFAGTGMPRWKLIPKSSAVFTLEPSGITVRLLGTAGVKLVLTPASGYPTYHGPVDFRTGFPQLREARRLEDFEGYFSWGLGLAHQSCKRVFTLTAPTRLVVDVPN